MLEMTLRARRHAARLLAVVSLCALCSCAGTLKEDTQATLDRVSRAGAALYAAYHANCDGREEVPECVEARTLYQDAANFINKLLEDFGVAK